MKLNYFAFAIPIALFFIFLEFFISKRKGKDFFNFGNTIANINVGIAERLGDAFITGIFYYFYEYLYLNFAIFNIKPSAIIWISIFLFTDFIWYWYHRLAHEINVLWGIHIVHHQSEDFNYTVSARITVLQAIVRTGFWSILPILGFPPSMIITILLIHGAYPFFIHTQLINKLGVLEYIFVTPSHHRVHHASNEKYLDKNYGDVLIIWDKIFGTFIEENEKPIFGLTKPLNSYSFLWQHFHFLLEIFYAVKTSTGLKNKFKIIFGKPERINANIREGLEKIFLFRNNSIPKSKRFKNYVIFQIAFILIFLFFFLLFENYFSIVVQVGVSSFILVTLINCGAILEQRKWVFYLEYIRASIFFSLIYIYEPYPTTLFTLSVMLLLSTSYFSLLQKNYLILVYGHPDQQP